MINNINIKPGYKLTEIGVIPEDWEVKNIISSCTMKARIGWQGLTKDEYLSNGEYLLITGTDFSNGSINWEKCCFVSQSRYQQDKNIQIKPCDILITKDGTIGKVAFVKNMPFKATLNSGVFVIRPKTNSYISSYLFYIFTSDYFANFLTKLVAGSTIIHLYQKDFVSFIFPLPKSNNEQTAIANTLGSVDELISSLEKLIAKKKAIKQGAMQELLKPKDGWVVKKLGEIGDIYGGLSGKSKIDFVDGKKPYIPFMNIMKNPIIDTNYLDYVNIAPKEMQNRVIKGDLFFNGSSETPEEVGMCSVLLKDVPDLFLNSFCFGYRLFKEYQLFGLYLAYYFRSSEGRKVFYAMAQGATRYNLSKNNFEKLEIPLPKMKVQSDIASMLYEIDSEIGSLEKKLEKYKKIKLGMMQELLTGKVRLV